MFLVRSIRRRLVSLFTVALLLMIGLTGIGIVGLIWHQEAVDDLDFLLHRRPNHDQLVSSVVAITDGMFDSFDLRQPEAVEKLRGDFLRNVDSAEVSLFEFRRRIEALPLTDQLTMQQRDQVMQRLEKIYQELLLLRRLSPGFAVTSTVGMLREDDVRWQAAAAADRIQRILNTLPAYQTKVWVEMSLEKERERSSRLLRTLGYVSGVATVIFIVILTCGFRWISIPVRSIAKGCTRIANGDIGHRLPPVSRWQDEFADVVSGVNCMADRFQQAEEDLQYKVQERSEQLVRSQKLASVGYLAASVAHEINNPLSAISMAAESLEFRLYELIGLQTPDAREALDRVAMIRRESRRCGDITARLLDFSRGEKAGRIATEIPELIREVLAIVQHLEQYRDRAVVFECDRCIVAEVNAAQLKQVVLNLVANGLQSTLPGGVVTIRLLEQVDSIVLAVADNGCGMDSDTLQHVFDPFFTTRETGQGTGLGLSITHRIIEDHGGTVTPLSEGPGCGSTFQIRLPKRQPQVNAA